MIVCPKCGYVERSKQRSGQQNRYYHGVVIERLYSSEIGYNREEWHEILKHKFLRTWRTIPSKAGPEAIEITRSTTELSTKEFEEFMSQARQWASEIGVWIPEPNEGNDAV